MNEADNKAAVDAWVRWFKDRFDQEPIERDRIQRSREIDGFNNGYAAGREEQRRDDLTAVEDVKTDHHHREGRSDGYDLDTCDEITRRITESGGKQFSNADDIIAIDTLEGRMIANRGDWIIRGIKGELYPGKPDIFEATYEPVTEEQGK